MAIASLGFVCRSNSCSFPFRPPLFYCVQKVRRSSFAAAVEGEVLTKEDDLDSTTHHPKGDDFNVREWKKLSSKELGITTSMITKPTRLVLNGLRKKDLAMGEGEHDEDSFGIGLILTALRYLSREEACGKK